MATKQKWRCRSPRSFFGLTSEYIEAVYEQFFFLKYHGGWSFSEAYNLPIGLREWFVKRLVKQIKEENDAMNSASSGGGSNSQVLNKHNAPTPPPQFRSITKGQG